MSVCLFVCHRFRETGNVNMKRVNVLNTPPRKKKSLRRLSLQIELSTTTVFGTTKKLKVPIQIVKKDSCIFFKHLYVRMWLGEGQALPDYSCPRHCTWIAPPQQKPRLRYLWQWNSYIQIGLSITTVFKATKKFKLFNYKLLKRRLQPFETI